MHTVGGTPGVVEEGDTAVLFIGRDPPDLEKENGHFHEGGSRSATPPLATRRPSSKVILKPPK